MGSKHYIPQRNGNSCNTRSLPRTGYNLERIDAILITSQTNRHRVEFSQRTGKILSIFRKTTHTIEKKHHQPQGHANITYHSPIQNYSRLNVGTEILEHRQL